MVKRAFPAAAAIATVLAAPLAIARADNPADAARASQPEWSSPLVTTSAMLEQRVRVDAGFQRAGNGTSTTLLDGGKALDLIITESDEVQIAGIPYVLRRSDTGRGALAGLAEWPILRLKHRLASSPAAEGNYILSAWLQVQAPTGIGKLSSHTTVLLPTLGFGKGWGDFDVQGTFGLVAPLAREAALGTQITGNIALQYRILTVFWPQIEANWTYYPNGPRGGLHQVFFTPGLVVGRLPITERLRATFGVGYQTAMAPQYRPSPLTPAYDHAWLVSARLNF